MECKDIHFYCLVSRYRIGIYPEWNVKEQANLEEIKIGTYWNISRMECKVASSLSHSSDFAIGIYPEWNVKFS